MLSLMKALFLAIFLLFFTSLQAAHTFEDPMIPWGVDKELVSKPTPKKEDPKPSLTTQACVKMIRFFQVYISPIDGPRSSFYPTSSQYALLAIQKHGVCKGIAMGCDRLMRENKEEWVYPTAEVFGNDRKLDPVR